LQDRALSPFRLLKQKGGGFKIVGKYAAGDTVGKHPLNIFRLSFPLKHPEAGGFTLPKKLNPLMGKKFIKSQQGLARPVQFRAAYLPGQTLPSADTLQIQGIMFFQFKIKEIQNGKTLIGHGSIVE
jgi:hypothetical protein